MESYVKIEKLVKRTPFVRDIKSIYTRRERDHIKIIFRKIKDNYERNENKRSEFLSISPSEY